MKKLLISFIVLSAGICFCTAASQVSTLDVVTEKTSQILKKSSITINFKFLHIIENGLNKVKGNQEKSKLLNGLMYNLIKEGTLKPYKYAIAISPTPIFYTGNIEYLFGGKDGKTLKLDSYKQIDELETIAYTGAIFGIYGEQKIGNNLIYKVYTNDYPYTSKTGLYIDSRFVKIIGEQPKDRQIKLSDKTTIINKAISLSGLQYVRGGNMPSGINKILEFYKPKSEISNQLLSKWILKGVDCSGLLYYATDGFTPRNTSSLITYGSGIDIEGQDINGIIAKLQPLDLIVWKGHMVLVISPTKVIESVSSRTYNGAEKSGVLINETKIVLSQILETRTPANDYNDAKWGDKKRFVVRRWFK